MPRIPRKTYDEIEVHCVLCGEDVPRDRVMRGAITCTKEHAIERRKQQRAMKEQKECDYCKRPSTPEEREAFKRFRNLERKRPELLYPDAFEIWKADTGKTDPKAFAEARKN